MQISEPKFSTTEAPSISVPTAQRDSGFIFKSKIIFFIKIGVAILTLLLLIKSIQLESLWNVFKSANWPYMLTVIFLIIPNILVQTLKWHYILRLANSAVPFLTAYKSLIVGFPLGFVTPGRLGEIGRAFYVPELSQFKTFKLVILDKTTNLSLTVLAGLVGVLTFSKLNLTPHLKTTLFLILVLVSGLIIYAICSPKLCKLLRHLIKIYHFKNKNMVALITFSSIFYFIFLCQFLLLLYSFQNINIFSTTKAAASVFLVKSILPISFGDLGIREGASIFFFNKIGVESAAAFDASLLLYFFNIGIPTLLGLPTIWRTKRRL